MPLVDAIFSQSGSAMPIFNIPASTPLSFLFFIAAAIAVHYGSDAEALRLFARSAFLLFVALGPLRWAETLVSSLPFPWREQGAWHCPRIEDIDWLSTPVAWAACLIQICLLALAFLDGNKAVGALGWL